MDNLKIGFYRNSKSKNALRYPWLSRFNNDGTHIVNENPIEWEKKTIKEFFTHIKLGTFGRRFTLADFLKSYKPVLFSKGKKKTEIFHLEFLDQIVEQFSEHVERHHLNKELVEVIEDQDYDAVDRGLETLGKSREEDYESELQNEWEGKLVKTKDGKVCKITYIKVCEGSYDWDERLVWDSAVECECEEDDNVTFTLEYAKKNLVEEEEIEV
tara:strand:+ start:141 stop:779 length:639 start_codon:yes stop_codon:yes gene_type:complete